MDNTEEILSKFGGVITNDLNNVLQIDEENDERLSTFSRSLYIDINQNGPFDLPKRKTFNMFSISIQSINAKFNNLCRIKSCRKLKSNPTHIILKSW